MINVTLIPMLEDNYAYLIEDEQSGKNALLDPADAMPAIKVLNDRDIHLDYILITHHHFDHVGGLLELKDKYGCEVFGPEAERSKIDGLDTGLSEDDTFTFGIDGTRSKIYDTPGHTAGHIIYHFEEDNIVFTGDTLFSMGTGRLFEGTAHQMWHSLQKIMQMPDETMIYCGHEYTEEKGDFCLMIEPDNAALQKRMEQVRNLRNDNKPTLPVSLKTEKETNCMLRAGSAERYAELRSKNDEF